MNPYALDPAEHASVLVEVFGSHEAAVNAVNINLQGPSEKDRAWFCMVAECLREREQSCAK